MINQIKNILEIQKTRVSWDEYFMSIALLSSSRSSCNKLHVGCVIVKDNRIISVGYNGFLTGAQHKSIIQNDHEQATVHAEQNAVTYAAKYGVNINNSTAYITHYPCINCTKILLSAGIKKIKYLDDYKNNLLVKDLLLQTGVAIHKI